MTIALMLLFAMGLIRWAPDAPASRWLRHWLVDLPARRLARMSRRQMVFVALIAMTVIVGGELLAALGPLDAGLVLLWDVAAWVDAGLGIAVVASATRLRPMLRIAVALLRRPRPRHPRRAVRRARAAANDPDRPALADAA